MPNVYFDDSLVISNVVCCYLFIGVGRGGGGGGGGGQGGGSLPQ